MCDAPIAPGVSRRPEEEERDVEMAKLERVAARSQ